MICKKCCDAADQRLPASAHCDSRGGPGARCTCQHQPPRALKRYRLVRAEPPVEELLVSGASQES